MRWAAGIVGGFLVGLLAYFLISLVAVTPQIWALPVIWLLAGWWLAKSGRFAWARAWLTLAIMSFALPLTAIVFSGRMGSEAINQAASDAEAAGAAIGATLGAGVLVGVTGFIGFFLGIIFLVAGYFTYRGAKDAAKAASATEQKAAG